MGHQRLGDIATSRKWRDVVSAVAEEGKETDASSLSSQAVGEIAELTLSASEAGLDRAILSSALVQFSGNPSSVYRQLSTPGLRPPSLWSRHWGFLLLIHNFRL